MRASSWALAPLLLALGCDGSKAEPLTAPRGFEAMARERVVRLGWTPSRDEGAETAIVRWAGAAPGELPASATLEVGRAFGAGVVLYVGDGDTFVDASLDGCAAYTYGALSVADRRGHSAVVSAAVPAGATVRPATAPPASLDATTADDGIALAWGAPAAPADHVRVVRREGALVAGPDDGEIVTTAVTAQAFFDPIDGLNGVPGLVSGATYHYAAYACDACASCETVGAHASASAPIVLGATPGDLEVDPNGAMVDFRWKAPELEGAGTMRLLFRLNDAVEGADDPLAEVIYEGAEAEAHVAMATFLPDVLPDELHYHFAVYSCVGDVCGDGAPADRAFSLREALRGGGYTVYFAHGEAGICADHTDLGTAETTEVPDWWKSCARSCDVATAEQLSAAGYEDAEAAGLALRNASIPFDHVLSSEYCRAVETAQRLEIIAPLAIETRPELTPFVHASEEARCEAIVPLLAGSALRAPDSNAAIVGHVMPCAGLDTLAPGEALVLKPNGEGPLEIARVLPAQWSELP